MPKRSGKSKLKRAWSEEEIRQRGVRAVVAALRLSKEYRQLSRERACHLEEARILRRYVNQVRSLNKTLRQLLAREKDELLSDAGNGNTWLHNGASHSQKRRSRQRK
jgi:uncharacterized lipoprotein YmbA